MPAWADDPLFSHLHPSENQPAAARAAGGESNKEVNYASLISTAASAGAAQKLVLDALLAKLTHVLSVELANLDPSRPLHAYGVDSLVSVGLRAWFAKELKADLAVGEVTGQGSIAMLAQVAAAKSKLVPKIK